MRPGAGSPELASQARRHYGEQLIKGFALLVNALLSAAQALQEKPAENAVAHRRRETFKALHTGGVTWHKAMVAGLRKAMLFGNSGSRHGELPVSNTMTDPAPLSLVDDETIEREILTSRLALSIMDRASWEFSDLRSRIASLERREELDPQDMLRAHVLARIVVQAWRVAGCELEGWRELQQAIQDEFAHLVEEAYHETNRWLLEQGVLADIDLRPFIRRAVDSGRAATGDSSVHSGFGSAAGKHGGTSTGVNVQDETRLMTRSPPLARSPEQAEAVLGRLNRLVARHLPQFAEVAAAAAPVSPGLAQAIAQAQSSIRSRLDGTTISDVPASPSAVLQELHQRKQALKQAATSQDERAIIEIVALLFQSILTEDRIPAALRVWFARLQMPVLRVAVGEPDFFATVQHPARRLIDRMGACVMGFDSTTRGVDEALEKEIKRIVQVVEAYPDTGRRVFQMVLTEFEKFLENYFTRDNEATRKAVSLSQQVEQRETLAIQYTIELRRMLNEMPVQDGVRQFLFQVWADVLATSAVRYGVNSAEARAMKKAASDLIWSASAKVSREERSEVIKKLTPLLKLLRDGMASAGIDSAKQEAHIKALNNSLAAAFTAKAPVIPQDRLNELSEQLETLEEMLPDASEAIDDSIVFEISARDNGDLEVITEGGSMPTPAMVAWARELQVGSWFMLEHDNRHEPVQLAWQGLRKHLSLFVSPSGHCLLFQQQRLASFLQAGLMVPAQEEALTVRATRNALAKLDGDPARLLD
jgi:Protein of unknown function (DUF1631)